MFYADILELLLEYSDIRTIINVGRASIANYSALVDMLKRYRRAGTTVLYPRQAAAIDELTAKIVAGERKITFAAPMSFGKTLVAIELARAYMKKGAVYIVIPAGIEIVWKKELARFYPKMMGKGKVADRQVLFATPKQTAQRNFVMSLAATPSLLRGRIIITTSYGFVSQSVAALVIKDEGHLNSDATEEFTGANPTIPCIIMGASESGIESERVSFQDTYLAIPEVEDEIIMKPPHDDVAIELIGASSATHIVLALPSASDASSIIARIRRRVYDYTSRSVRMLDAFTRDGGILVTSIRMIAEGNNFNKCAHMIIMLPFTRFGADALISLRRVQQVRNRICRQSSNHTHVKVSYVTNHPVMLARAMLARTDALGYEVPADKINVDLIVQKIMPIYKTLSLGELITLLAIPVEATYSCGRGTPVLTAAELIAIANA